MIPEPLSAIHRGPIPVPDHRPLTPLEAATRAEPCSEYVQRALSWIHHDVNSGEAIGDIADRLLESGSALDRAFGAWLVSRLNL